MLEHHTAKPFPVEVRMTKPIVRNCRTCGKSFQSPKTGGYCGMACYRVAQRSGKYAGIRPIMDSRIHKCANCGVEVRGVSKGKCRDGRTAENKFCGRGCYDQFRTKIRERKARPCDFCGKSYIRHTLKGNSQIRFCSAECRNQALKASPRHCVSCGAWMTPIRFVKATGKFVSLNSGKVCSRECLINWFKTNPVRKAKISAAFSGDKHPNWQGGKLPRDHRSTWDKIADAIRDRDAHECRRCGKSEADNGCRLDVHHIVPRRECLSLEIANHPENLISLCGACHMRVEWESGQKRGTRRKGKQCRKAA